jgi:Ca-activated chloride channel family protein
MAATVVAAGSKRVSAQTGRLEFADKPRLLNCQPSTDLPAFRVQFNLLDDKGAPLPLTFGSDELRQKMTIVVDERQLAPFFAVSHTAQAETRRDRMALVLVDVSGSMNMHVASGGTRFQEVQAALREFVQMFQDGADQVAIVPFESHDVVSQINGAVFATTKAQVLAQIDALPVPKPRNNTAIYSSVVAGVDVLDKRLKAAKPAAGRAEPTALLVVMTDGKNEIIRGDDPGLLDGPAGLARAADVVQASGLQVVAIGFGDPGAVDQAALARLTRQSFLATDSGKLKQVFAIAHALLTDRITATFASDVWPDVASLEGRTLTVHATLAASANERLTSPDSRWAAPQMGVPTFDDNCDREELRAALAVVPTTNRWVHIVRPLLVFVGIGTVLLVLWFLVPRLVWSEQYAGDLPKPSRGRWADATGATKADGYEGRPAPAGFQHGKAAGPAARAASDRTVVSPGADLSRSRLQRPADRRR